MRTLQLLAALVLVGVQVAKAEVVSEKWVQNWRADLEFVRQTLPETHANLFHTLAKENFNTSIETLSTRVPGMSQHEIIVELSAIVASIGDGHTRLSLPMVDGSGFSEGHSSTQPPNDPSMVFNYYPIRLYMYSDGLYVRSIGVENAAYAGAKVVQIGRLQALDAIQAVSRTVQRDNDQQLKNLAPERLVIPEVLAALKITNSAEQADFILETADSKQHKLTLLPVAKNQAVVWVSAADQAEKKPLYLRDTDSNYWFEPLGDKQTVYWQYNEVNDMAEESIADFATRLGDYIASHGIQRLIIDLRFNSGGDNTLNRSLLHALIRSPGLREPGSLFVITGRGTFSAAMMFAIDLEKHTNAIFVGEPTGASPNHYGDSRKVILPNSGLTIRVSTLYWQYAGPNDKRLSLKPQIPAELSSQDFRNGRDPAMAAILDLFAKPQASIAAEGDWTGRALGYDTVIHVSKTQGGWEAKIDFVDMDTFGLPLTQTMLEGSTLWFNFQNGDEVISFKGELRGDWIIGKTIVRGQSYPWVASRQ